MKVLSGTWWRTNDGSIAHVATVTGDGMSMVCHGYVRDKSVGELSLLPAKWDQYGRTPGGGGRLTSGSNLEEVIPGGDSWYQTVPMKVEKLKAWGVPCGRIPPTYLVKFSAQSPCNGAVRIEVDVPVELSAAVKKVRP